MSVLVGKKVTKIVGFVNYGYFVPKEKPNLYYTKGFVIEYEDGYKSISNGGCSSGADLIAITVINKDNEIVEKYSEIY